MELEGVCPTGSQNTLEGKLVPARESKCSNARPINLRLLHKHRGEAQSFIPWKQNALLMFPHMQTMTISKVIHTQCNVLIIYGIKSNKLHNR